MASKEQYFQGKDGALFVLLNVQKMQKIFLYNFKCILQVYCLSKIGYNRKKDHTTDGIHRPVHYRILNIRMLDFL